MKPYFGNVGDYVDVTLANGEIIKGIIGDIKGNENAGFQYSKYAHGNSVANSSVVEFVVDKNSWYNTDKSVVKYKPNWRSTVAQVSNLGNYWGTGGTESEINVPEISLKDIDMGGADENIIVPNAFTKSSIVDSKYTSTINGITKPATEQSEFRPVTTNVVTNNSMVEHNTTTEDINRVIRVIGEAVQVLNSIANNTADSNKYLDEINNKEFVDTELRNSLKSLKPRTKNVTNNSSYRSSTNASNMRSILNITNP